MAVAMRYSPNNEVAEDVISDAFTRVFKNISLVNVENGNLEGWVRKIVVNTAIDYFRKNKKHNVVDSIDDDLKYIQIKSKETEFEIGDVTGEYIIKMIQELPDRYREAFNLHVIEGMQHKEISKILGISEGTSKSNNSRAKKMLRFKIDKRNSEEEKRILNLGICNLNVKEEA